MASIWKIGTVDIYVDAHTIEKDVKIAKLTPLDSVGTSTLHFFGSGAEEISVGGKVFSETNVAAIETYANAGTTVALTSEQGNEGNYKIQSFSAKKYGPFVSLSLTGYAEDDTIYDFQMKLLKV